METLFYLSLGLNIILLGLLARKKTKKSTDSDKQQETPSTTPTTKQKTRPVVNVHLRAIAEMCEEKLPEEDRGKIKLLVDSTRFELAALQIGELRISLCRNNTPQSLFYPRCFCEALKFARDGYSGTARYLPVPDEVKFVWDNRNIINTYLKALTLEEIQENDKFFCIDTQTGWATGWNRFNWDLKKAHGKFRHKFKIWTKDQNLKDGENKEATMFLLLKGWDHLFTEV